MFTHHPALALSQQFPQARDADPHLSLALVASDYVLSRIQTDPKAQDTFCHDILHHNITETQITTLAAELLPKVACTLTGLPLVEATSKLVTDELTLPQEEEMMQGLRKLRHAVMLRIIGRMVCNIATCHQTLLEVSTFADWVIRFTTRYSERQLAVRYGLPASKQGEIMEILVIGMGKLGGYELNLSSDVDLIFVYPDQGETKALHDISVQAPQQQIQQLDASRFFIRVGRQIIALLDKVTSDGFVFRTDMRLRPYGDSGALVSSFAELRNYYYEQARSWERFALSRARILTGNQGRIAELEAMIEEFVYRRHVDFGVVHHLRKLSAGIRLMAQRQDAEDNIKIGAGGIREVEFYAQTLQLVYGGVYSQLREANTTKALEYAHQAGLLHAETGEQLISHYLWLRELENRIQAMADEQTQCLPKDTNKLARIAAGMGFAEVKQFHEKLEQVRQQVHQYYVDLLRQGDANNDNRQPKVGKEWHQLAADLFAGTTASVIALLPPEAQSTTNATETTHTLGAKLESFFVKLQGLDDLVQADLRDIMPVLLRGCFVASDPHRALVLVFELLNVIIRRPVYISLLCENQHIFSQLISSMISSGWCARQLLDRPMLLFCFLESTTTWEKPDRALIIQKLQLQLFSLPENDLEQEMDALRHFALASNMQVALAQISASLSLMQVSDYLSYTAEACIEAACRMAWKQLTQRHGAPGEDELSGLVVIAFGKLGGLEMSYTSDLDLVFLFDQPADPQGTALTNGAKPITGIQFYQRLAQRVIHLLSAPTAAGFAYNIDTRLRPNGQDGLLACTLAAWQEYYQKNAWTWELQSLVRARPLCGSPRAITACQQARTQLLAQKRDQHKLRQEVLEMRTRIGQTHGNTGLKYMQGGLVDIEFIVQYLVLAYAAEHPELVQFSDNVRIIQALEEKGVLNTKIAQQLKHTYLEVRNLQHADYLELHQSSIDLPQLGCTTQLWNKLFNIEAS